MPHDPARVAETREWLQKASLDFRGARIDLDAQPPLLEDVLFRKTHSLEELASACEGVDPALKPALDPAVPLTEFAWAFRYPGDHPTPTVAEARQGLATARRAVAALVACLPDETLPKSFRDHIS